VSEGVVGGESGEGECEGASEGVVGGESGEGESE